MVTAVLKAFGVLEASGSFIPPVPCSRSKGRYAGPAAPSYVHSRNPSPLPGIVDLELQDALTGRTGWRSERSMRDWRGDLATESDPFPLLAARRA